MLKRSIGKSKLAVGLVAAAMTAVVGTAGLSAVYAHGDHPTPPATKEECKNGGWEELGFKNQGECVSAWNHNNPPGGGNGGGYGGSNGNTVNANVNVDLNNSDNNIINVIVRILFG
jgi:hypothetical protein